MTVAKKLIDIIKDGEGAHVLRKDVIQLLSELTEGVAIEVASVRRGDVFLHKLVGGKMRPWVTLSCREGLVVALSMTTSGPAPMMVKCDCRFWDGYIGPTVSLFNEEEVRKYVAHPYTNLDHLREIEAHFASLTGLRALPGGHRNLEVPDRQESRQVRRARKRVQPNPSRAPENILELNKAKGA